MIGIKIILQGDGAFGDWADRKIHHVRHGLRIAGLDNGMESGAPSVMIGIDLGGDDKSDNGVVMAETSLALFLTTADALKAKFGDPRIEQPGPPPKSDAN